MTRGEEASEGPGLSKRPWRETLSFLYFCVTNCPKQYTFIFWQSLFGSGCQEWLGWASLAQVYLEWKDYLQGSSLTWLVRWRWLMVGGLSSSPLGLSQDCLSVLLMGCPLRAESRTGSQAEVSHFDSALDVT